MCRNAPASGIAKKQIRMAVAQQYSLEEFENAIAYLIDEGHLYTTTDDEHLRA